MKLLYISFVNESTRAGYMKKILNQSIGFSDLGIKTFLTARNNDSFWLGEIKEREKVIIEKINVPTTGKGLTKYTKYVSSLCLFFDFCLENVYKLQPDAVYIRQIRPISPMLINLIKKIKQQGCIVLYEYPTYPWKAGLLLGKKYLSYVLDVVQYKKLLKSIDAMVVMGKCQENTCDVIETMNGMERRPLEKTNQNSYPLKKESEVSMIVVCHYGKVHGIEKVVRGIKEYYKRKQNIDFKLRIVGPEDAFKPLKDYIHELKIEQHVQFFGYMVGEELDKLYKQSDIGLDAIGLEIRGEDCICGSLKSREYVSYGLPFVCSDMLDIVYNGMTDKRFMYVVDHSVQTVNIEELIAWYKNINVTSDEIVEYGMENLTWDKTMKPVAEYIYNIIGGTNENAL